MTHQNLPDKDQSDSLTIGLGGEERAEQLRFHLFADSLAVVHHFDNGRRKGADDNLSILLDAFRSILDDVYQYLFEEGGIHFYLFQRFVYLQTKFYVPVGTHTFHKTFACKCEVIQVDKCERRFGNLHYIGKTGDETAHRETAFGTYTHDIANIIHAFFGRKRLFYRIQCGGYSGSSVVHFVGNHADHFLVGFLLCLHHFVRQTFYQEEGVLKSTVNKRGMRTPINIRIIQTDGSRFSFRYVCQLGGKRRIYLVHLFTQNIFLTDTQHFLRHRVQLGKVLVQCGEDDSHRRGFNQQVKEVILFAETETFIL